MERFELRSSDGTPLAGYRWKPVGEPRGDVLLVHGLADHMGRYGHVARALNAAGYRVTGLDLRGHGGSGGRPGHVDRWDQYVEDLRAAARSIGGPHAILCHSMGGLVTLDHLRDGSAWAVVTSGPALGMSIQPPLWKAMGARILTRWFPRLSMSNEIDPTWVCSDTDVVADYLADPKVFQTVTPRWYTEMLHAMERVQATAPQYDIPLFATWGSEDRVVSTEAIRRFTEHYGGPVVARERAGLFHEVLNEPSQNQAILQEIIAWLDAIPSAPTS